MLQEKCAICTEAKKIKKHKFKYKKRYTLTEGAHLTIICPESNIKTHIVWKKDSTILKQGIGSSFRKKDTETRLLVDTFSTLYLIGVSKYEEGNYTCYVNDIKMMQLKINVVSKSRLLTQGKRITWNIAILWWKYFSTVSLRFYGFFCIFFIPR